MPIATIHKLSQGGDLYHVHFLESVDPGFGQGRPDRPDQGLPGSGLYPGNRPPGSFNPVFPSNSLPGGPPPHINPGETLVLIRDQAGVWHYAALQPGSPPPRPLPMPPPARPDQGLPPYPSQGLPGGPPPVAGQTLPPTAAPKPA